MSRANLPIIPDSMTVITGDETGIERKMEAFFLEIIHYLGYDEDSAGVWCRIERQKLCQFAPELRDLDEELVTLRINGRVIASVIYSRTESNYVQASFAHYLSLPNILRCQCRASRR